MTLSGSQSVPRIVISGLRGGSGKTILSLSLITLLNRRGMRVSPFKKGPDYIDAGWLARAAGVPCFNLDLFMVTPGRVLGSFLSHSRDSHLALIEGNRGLFDGVDHRGTFSTARLAKLLKAPVVLVIDCTKATNTVAAMVLGCQKMDRRVSIRGVVLNNIATGRQESLIRKAIREKCSLPVVGVFPRLRKDPFPERHMGLTPSEEHREAEKSLAVADELGAKCLDLESILRIAGSAAPLGPRPEPDNLPASASPRRGGPKRRVKIGIIRDSAFQFYYPDNFEELRRRGAELTEVSPLMHEELPDIDALYIGGGFPETHAIALSKNRSFKKSLRRQVELGLPVYAECGGLMYLGKRLILKGRSYPMSGILPIVFDLQKRPQAHGYTVAEVDRPNPYFPAGCVLRGHEFHYSRVVEIQEDCSAMALKMKRGTGIRDGRDGICYRNVFATYTHLHALGAPEWTEGLIRRATGFKKARGKS